MSIHTKIKQPATVTFPLTGLKPLYRGQHGKTLVFEVDVDSLKKVNEPNTIDEMVAEAHLEYALGKSKTFTSADALIKDLHS